MGIPITHRTGSTAGFLARVLAHPRNRHYLDQLTTARTWHVRPLEYFGIEQAGSFTDTDRLLTLALTYYEASLCPDCHTPAASAFDPDMDGWFEIDDTHVCMACAARERYQKNTNPDTIEPGTKLTIVNTKGDDDGRS